jgi:hypothetical protein
MHPYRPKKPPVEGAAVLHPAGKPVATQTKKQVETPPAQNALDDIIVCDPEFEKELKELKD